MSDWDDEEDDAPERRRALSNLQVMRFVWRQWMRQPRRWAATSLLMLLATFCDLSIPWAAWALLASLYVAYFGIRTVSFRLMNKFAARNMEALINDAFQRVQSFSSDWHANTFAGATVRRVSRAMWGYDSVSDGLILMLGPTLIVL